MMRPILLAAAVACIGSGPASADTTRQVIDVHIHYSNDAWTNLPPPEAIKVLRDARLKKAFVSSSSDDGTQMLFKAAPDLIVPVLRPYRSRGETGTWTRDPSIITHVEARLKANKYAGIGEFHAYGADADTAVMKRMVELAKQYKIFLHAHSDADAVERMFKHDPSATVLWAHCGFAQIDKVREMVTRHKNLWADLAFRSDHAPSGKLDATWKKLFLDFPERFMVGTDTYTPERWHYVVENATYSRKWLADLPAEVADNIAHRNAERLAAWALGQ
jgi:predicted TIM-barrel fold metal-dependent hydrolase